MLLELGMFARFAFGLRRFLRRDLTLEEAREMVRLRMAAREENFLRLVEKGIFGHPRSPYLPLMRLARCEPGDIRRMVGDRGLEPTLLALRAAGVYVTFEEFKGRRPIVREGRTFPVGARDFDNPYLRSAYRTESGGSTGAGIRISTDLDLLAEQSAHHLISAHAYGIAGLPTALWYGTLPEGTGLNALLRFAHCGLHFDRWFTPHRPGELGEPLAFRLANRAVVSMARMHGARLPSPEPVPLDRAGIIARWAAGQVRTHGAAVVRTTVSRSLRVSVAAREEGLDLTGVTFLGGSEPVTAGKVAAIAKSGARFIPTYAFVESGVVAHGCARPVSHDDLHVFKDIVALVRHPRRLPGSDLSVDAFHFTSLLPAAARVMLNVEMDDYGVVETRACGCPLEEFGLTDHLREIRSFTKLTGEGVSLVGSGMVRILEEVLPARFGGSPLDYQLMEEEDERGFTRLSLLVDPSVRIPGEAEVIGAVLQELERGDYGEHLGGKLWSQAGAFRVRRMKPVWTARGKLLPLHLDRTGKLPRSGGREREEGG